MSLRKRDCNSSSAISSYLIVLLALVSFIGLTSASLIDKEDALVNDNLGGDSNLMFKKSIDKLRYFGGLGKREFGADSESNESLESSSEDSHREKRLDKLKYFGGLGKKRAYTNEELLKSLRLAYIKKSKSNIDRLRYMGNLGK